MNSKIISSNSVNTDVGSSPVILQDLFNNHTKEAIKKVFTHKKVSHVSDCIEISSYPFNHCIVKDFLFWKDDSVKNHFFKSLQKELKQLDFNLKSNDLYKFRQTNELMITSDEKDFYRSCPCLHQFCNLLRNIMLPLLRDVIDPDLNDVIDMFSAQYSSTDHLLCHDDQLEGRRFAYIYYLTPDWSLEDGGTLDLYDSSQSNLNGKDQQFPDPGEIVKSVTPYFNSFVFFEVSSKSFHQVSEILSSSKTRLSLTGWFHGSTAPFIHRPIADKTPTISYVSTTADESILERWVNPVYMNLMTQGSIQEQFVDDSEVQLTDFLLSEQHEVLQKSLSILDDCKTIWDLCGPPNKCKYHKLKLDQTSTSESLTQVEADAVSKIRSFLEVFRSEEMFLFLSNISGLSLHPMAIHSDSEDDDVDAASPKRNKLDTASSTPGCRFQIRKWKKGDYTLIRDNDNERNEFALDVNLFFSSSVWKEDYGGCTTYLAGGEEEELLTILPCNNALTLTYRDKETMRFVQYINHTTVHNFHDLSLVYYE